MGDSRYAHAYARVAGAADPVAALRGLEDEEVISALGAASREADPLLANVLATEAHNRVRRLRASLASLGEGVVTLDLEGRVLWANPAAERLLGWTRAEMMSRDLETLVRHAREDGSEVPRAVCPLLEPGRSGATVTGDGEVLIRPDGSRVCIQFTSAPLPDPDGEPEGIVVTFSDCTQRKQSERALLESREWYKSLFDQSIDAIVSMDPSGIIQDANAAAERLAGVPVAEARGRSILDFVHPADVPSIGAMLHAAAAGNPQRSVFRVRRDDGGEILVKAWAAPIVVEGRVVGIHGLARAAADA